MTRTRTRTRTCLALFGGLVVAASACGGGGTDTAGSLGSGGSGRGAPEEFGLSLDQLAVRVEQTEQLIASCMGADGFRYLAVDFASVKAAMGLDQTAPGVSSEDYAKQFGLGITTQLDKPIVAFGAGPENNAALAALPESDQVAYRRALWGEHLNWNHARALEEEDFSEAGGCTRAAAEQAYPLAELGGNYVNPADKLVAQDPRMIAAMREWSSCMAAEAHVFDTPDQLNQDFRQRLEALSPGQDPRTLSGVALAALEELQGEERAVAVVHVACEEAHLEGVQEKVELEHYGARPS